MLVYSVRRVIKVLLKHLDTVVPNLSCCTRSILLVGGGYFQRGRPQP